MGGIGLKPRQHPPAGASAPVVLQAQPPTDRAAATHEGGEKAALLEAAVEDGDIEAGGVAPAKVEQP